MCIPFQSNDGVGNAFKIAKNINKQEMCPKVFTGNLVI